MKTIPKTFRKFGYDFNLIERNGNVAIYEQIDDGKIIAYEVHYIRIREEREAFGKTFGRAEILASNGEWGMYAYTCHSIERARARSKELSNKYRSLQETE